MSANQYLAIVVSLVGLFGFIYLATVEVKHWKWKKACDAIDDRKVSTLPAESDGRPIPDYHFD